MNFKKNQKIIYFLFSGTAIWLFLIVLAPFIKSSENYILKSISDYLYFFFDPVCHQIPERSILLNSEPFAVCIRCFAIYIGAFIFLIFLLFQKKKYNINPYLMILISIPSAADFALEKVGLYADMPIIRFLTGLLFGVAIIYLISYSIFDLKMKT